MWSAILGVVAVLGIQDALANHDGVGKDDKTITIASMGTSLTANYRWPRELAEQLSKCLVRKVDVEILAIPGANSSQADKQFSSRKNRRPNIVLIEFATNDADYLRGVGLTKSRSSHKELLIRIRKEVPRAQVVLMTMSPVFGLRGWVRPQLAAYYGMYRELAENNGAVLIDLVPIWGKFLGATGAEKLPDGLHPTENAASRIILPEARKKIGDLLKTSDQSCGE